MSLVPSRQYNKIGKVGKKVYMQVVMSKLRKIDGSYQSKHAERKPLPRNSYPLRLSLLEVLFTFTLGSRVCRRPPLRPITFLVVAHTAAYNIVIAQFRSSHFYSLAFKIILLID